MAQQEGGWPLGLQPLNLRIGLIRDFDYSGSLSFSTLVTASPSSSSVTSSDLDTESTGSFFHDRSITLGNLIGITNILELSSGSLRSRKHYTWKEKKNYKPNICFSLCPRAHLNCENAGNAPSLGQFLEVERKAGNALRKFQTPTTYELGGLPENQSDSEPNSLFSNGLVAPPLVLVGDEKKSDRWANRGLGHENGYRFPLTFSCMGGRS